MTFLNPLFLFGLAAAAIPLIIHLFNFRKPQTMKFSSLVFLQELQKSTMRRVRIKQWLLLALRMLAIALLVFSFARPVLEGTATRILGQQGRLSRAIVIDNSQSMMVRDGAGVYLEQARRVAEQLVEGLDNGDEVLIIPTITPRRELPGFSSRAAARGAIERVVATSGMGSLARAAARADRLLSATSNPNQEIFLISDLQESSLVDSVQHSLRSGIRLFLVPVGTRDHENVAVSDVRVLSRVLSVGHPVRLNVRITNYGKRPASDLLVSVFLDEERVAQTTVNVGPDQMTAVPVVVTPRTTGWLAGEIRIDDGYYSYDDHRAFSLFIPEERQILLVSGSGTDSRLLELALSEELSAGTSGFRLQVVDESNLARQTFEAYDSIVLAGVSDFSSGERSSIVRYVEGGGGVLLFPGDDLERVSYNELFAGLGGGEIVEVLGDVRAGFTVGEFERLDVGHPLFDGMFDESESGKEVRLEQPAVYKSIGYRPGSGDENTLIGMTGDWPFLEEIRFGAGAMLLFSVSPETSWSDFPVRGLFVPLIYRSLFYLSATGSVSGDEFAAGYSAEIRITGVSESDRVVIESDTGEDFTPDLRTIPGAQLLSVEAGVLKPGVYDVIANDRVVRRFSVHPVAPESRLKTNSPGESAETLSATFDQNVRLVDLAGVPGTGFSDRLEAARTGVELWNVFLLLALLSLVAEMVIEKNWRPETV